jgi:hypothetical protein
MLTFGELMPGGAPEALQQQRLDGPSTDCTYIGLVGGLALHN